MTYLSTCRMVFIEEQECKLSDHIKAFERFYGLSVKRVPVPWTSPWVYSTKKTSTISWKKHILTFLELTIFPITFILHSLSQTPWFLSTSKKAQHLPTVNKIMKYVCFKKVFFAVDHSNTQKLIEVSYYGEDWWDGFLRRNSRTIRTQKATSIAGNKVSTCGWLQPCQMGGRFLAAWANVMNPYYIITNTNQPLIKL